MDDPVEIRDWVQRSFEFTSTLPAKVKKPKQAKKGVGKAKPAAKKPAAKKPAAKKPTAKKPAPKKLGSKAKTKRR